MGEIVVRGEGSGSWGRLQFVGEVAFCGAGRSLCER